MLQDLKVLLVLALLSNSTFLTAKRELREDVPGCRHRHFASADPEVIKALVIVQLHVGCDVTGTGACCGFPAALGAWSKARENTNSGGGNGPGIREQVVKGETGGGKFI